MKTDSEDLLKIELYKTGFALWKEIYLSQYNKNSYRPEDDANKAFNRFIDDLYPLCLDQF